MLTQAAKAHNMTHHLVRFHGSPHRHPPVPQQDYRSISSHIFQASNMESLGYKNSNEGNGAILTEPAVYFDYSRARYHASKLVEEYSKLLDHFHQTRPQQRENYLKCKEDLFHCQHKEVEDSDPWFFMQNRLPKGIPKNERAKNPGYAFYYPGYCALGDENHETERIKVKICPRYHRGYDVSFGDRLLSEEGVVTRNRVIIEHNQRAFQTQRVIPSLLEYTACSQPILTY